MAYTISDIAELVRYHLVLAEPNDQRADDNLAQLVSELQSMASRPLFREASWVFCDRCGTSVDTDLIHPDLTATTTPAMAISTVQTAGRISVSQAQLQRSPTTPRVDRTFMPLQLPLPVPMHAPT
jgi:hypothetical protein